MQKTSRLRKKVKSSKTVNVIVKKNLPVENDVNDNMCYITKLT